MLYSSTRKYLPLKYLPLEIELELVGTVTDPIVIKDAKDYSGSITYTSALVSNAWQLEQCKIRCDLINLDNTLQNEFDNQLLSDNKNRLSIRFSNYVSQTFRLADNNGFDMSVNRTRPLSNFNRVFVSFIKDGGGLDLFYSREFNIFYSTLYTKNLPSLADEYRRPTYI